MSAGEVRTVENADGQVKFLYKGGGSEHDTGWIY
jgi:hypothetical protein